MPVIAKSSEAEGTISFDLEENTIPLSDPERANVRGKLTLHQVKVGPGPVVTELGGLLGAKLTKVTLANEQVVPIRVQDGRVYHEKLAMTVNGYTITTTGSVGTNGTLSLMAEVPIPESAVGGLLKNNPRIREAVVNKRITVPVTGTINKPQIDAKAFQTAVAKFVGDATKNVGRDLLGSELEKGLQKFLPKAPDPKKP